MMSGDLAESPICSSDKNFCVSNRLFDQPSASSDFSISKPGVHKRTSSKPIYCHPKRQRSSYGRSLTQKSVKFGDVEVYKFLREQGFVSVPDKGGCTLGMAAKHFTVDRYDIHHYRMIKKFKRKLMQDQAARTGPSLLTSGVSSRKRGRGRGRFRDAVSSPCSPSSVTPGTRSSLSPGDSRRVPIFPSPPNLSPQPYNAEAPCDFLFMLNSKLLPMDQGGFAFCGAGTPPRLSPPSPGRYFRREGYNTPVLKENLVLSPTDTDSDVSLDQFPPINSPCRTRIRKTSAKLLPIHSTARAR
ncbi:unnamed protein product, partial [Protopolystoma xenopodis]